MKRILFSLLLCQISFGITANKVLRVPPGGTVPSYGPVNLADAVNAVTGLLPRSSVAAAIVSSSVECSFSTSSTSYVDVTDGISTTLSVDVVDFGRPIYVALVSGSGNANGGRLTADSGALGTAASASWEIFEVGPNVAVARGFVEINGASANPVRVGVPAFVGTILSTSAGTRTFKLRTKVSSAPYSSLCSGMKLVGYSL